MDSGVIVYRTLSSLNLVIVKDESRLDSIWRLMVWRSRMIMFCLFVIDVLRNGVGAGMRFFSLCSLIDVII